MSTKIDTSSWDSWDSLANKAMNGWGGRGGNPNNWEQNGADTTYDPAWLTPDLWNKLGYTGDAYTFVPGENGGNIPSQDLSNWLNQTGYKVYEKKNTGNTRVMQAVDPQGNMVGDPVYFDTNDNQFKVGALLAAAIATGGIAAAGGGAGAGAGVAAEGAGAGAGGAGVISGGSGLTAGGAASGAGITAAPGAGLALAAPTGSGAGLAAGTGGNIIGAGIGSSIPAGSMIGGGSGAATSGGLGSLTGSKLGDQVVNNLGGKLVNGAIGAVLGGGNGAPITGGTPPAASTPAGELAKSALAYKAFDPSEVEAPAARLGHTRGPSSAVNLEDPSAALFGYGTQHKYYQTVDPTKEIPQPVKPGSPQSLAAGGSVMGLDDDDWSGIADLLGSVVDNSGGGSGDDTTAGNGLSASIIQSLMPASGRSVDYTLGSATPTSGTSFASPTDFASKYTGGDGFVDKLKGAWDGTTSWLGRLANGDKKSLGQVQLGLGALGLLNSYLNRNKQAAPSAAQMRAQLKSPYSNWTPSQQADFNKYFYQQVPSYVSPVKHAHGGSVAGSMHYGDDYCMGGLAHLARGGSLVPGGASAGGGQDDKVPARLSPGEYVMDADTVASLGDGDNAAGAAKLDQMRQSIRAHKRSAPATDIPPKARSPLHYLKK